MWVTCGSAAVASTLSSGSVTCAFPPLSWLFCTLPPVVRTRFKTASVSVPCTSTVTFPAETLTPVWTFVMPGAPAHRNA